MIPDPTGTQDFNRYMYVKGNPIRYSDPSGHVGIINTPVNPPTTGGGNESEGDNDATPYYNSSSYYPWNYTQQRQTPVKQTATTTFENMAKKFVSGSYDVQAGISPFAAVNLDFGWDYLSAIPYYWNQNRIVMSVGCLIAAICEMSYDTIGFEFLLNRLILNVGVRSSGTFFSKPGLVSEENNPIIKWSGKAHGTLAHMKKVLYQVADLVKSGKYSKIYINKSLKTAGLGTSGLRPDIIAIGKNGNPNIIFEVLSPSQTKEQLYNKIYNIIKDLPNTKGFVLEP